MESISLTTVLRRWQCRFSVSEKAFHEKAGRSQVGSFALLLEKVFLSAESPLSPSFHPHSSVSDFFARCKLGVLVSAGAATCLATCPPFLGKLGQGFDAVTGTRRLGDVFLLPRMFLSYAAVVAIDLLLCNGS